MASVMTGPIGDAESIRTSLAASRSGVIRVFGTGDDLPARLNLSALHVSDGRVGLLVRPGARRASWQWRDLLSGVGVSSNTSEPGMDLDDDEPVVISWLAAHQPTDVVIASAQLLTPAHMRSLLLVATCCGARVWVLCAPPLTNAQQAVLESWCAEPIIWAEFATAWADLPELFDPSVTPEPGDDRPRSAPAPLPAADFPTFLSACRRVLDADTLAWVESVFAADQQETNQWASPPVERDQLDMQAVATWLLNRYDRCATDAELLVATRATQVALFRLGVFVQVDHPHLLATAAHEPRRADRGEQLWRQLAIYREPYRGAVCALAATRLGTTDMLAVRCGDVSGDGSRVQLGDEVLDVEPGARIYLRAMRLLRQLHGAEPDGLLLAKADGSGLRPRLPGDAIKAARLETGIALTSRLVDPRTVDNRFHNRWGVSVQPLTAKPGSKKKGPQ